MVRNMLSPNTILRERYRIIHQLGHGGMGAVYQAMDENLSCVVAVKETFATTDEQRRAFRREAELLANLSHPTLPRVMDHFTHGEGQFLVMQFVPGHDLAELLELREQAFPPAKVIDWADQLLDALEELHSSDPPIIHRDIKPSNLKVTPKGKVLLLDFGLAKGVAGQMSTADVDRHGRSIYGYTPNYAPLEQMRGGGTDPRSDLYSLAATLWTLLTGQVPPDALSRVAEKEDGNPDPLRPAHEINPQVPVRISDVLTRAMSLNRNQRQASAAEFRNELRDVRQAEFEQATLPLQRPNIQKSTSLSPTPLVEGTIKAPEPAPQRSRSKPQQVPTMRVDSPPPVPSLESSAAVSTANSFAGEDRQRKTWKPAALIVTGVLFLAVSISVVAWSGWRPWAREQANGPTKTNPQVGTTVPANPKAPTGMVYVPGGDFTMGRDEKDGGDEYERPAHKVTVKPFFMDINEVTRQQYQEFVNQTGHVAPANWTNKHFPAGTGQQPVTDVTWDDANGYAKWAGKRLPNEEEWEFAARGTDGRLYPWGNDWSAGLANADRASNGMVDVGTYKGRSPFGAYDMVGNAWQWTASKLAAYPGGSIPQIAGANLKVIRGCTYACKASQSTTTYRRGWPATGADYNNTGFRCVEDVKR
jgi:formylglycine-generating enzyme required for sulfatase activity/predicted Ser/Thr protein kinase